VREVTIHHQAKWFIFALECLGHAALQIFSHASTPRDQGLIRSDVRVRKKNPGLRILRARGTERIGSEKSCPGCG
jgi:hypothetical protein